MFEATGFGSASSCPPEAPRFRMLPVAMLLLERDDGVARSAAGVFALRIVGAALSYALTLVLVRALGATEFGIYAQLFVAASLLGLVLPIGLNGAAVRFIPEYLPRGRPDRVAGVVSVSRLAVLAAALLAAVALGGAALLARPALPDGYFLPLLLAIACLPLLALLDLYESFARGFGWTILAYAPPYVLMPLAMLAALGIVIAAGGSANAATAMTALFAATAAALATLAVIFHARLPHVVGRAEPRRHTRIWVLAALPLVVVEASRALLEQTDILMLGAFAEPAEVAAYFAAARTAGLLGFIAFSVSALAVPGYARLTATRDKAALQDFVRGTLHLSFWPTLCGVAALVLVGRTILTWFDASFAAAYPALVVLAAGFLIKAAAGPVEYLLNAGGDQRAAGGIYLAGAAVNVAFNLALIPALGLIGAASATTLSILVVTVLLVERARRRLGIVSFLRPGGGCFRPRERPDLQEEAL